MNNKIINTDNNTNYCNISFLKVSQYLANLPSRASLCTTDDLDSWTDGESVGQTLGTIEHRTQNKTKFFTSNLNNSPLKFISPPEDRHYGHFLAQNAYKQMCISAQQKFLRKQISSILAPNDDAGSQEWHADILRSNHSTSLLLRDDIEKTPNEELNAAISTKLRNKNPDSSQVYRDDSTHCTDSGIGNEPTATHFAKFAEEDKKVAVAKIKIGGTKATLATKEFLTPVDYHSANQALKTATIISESRAHVSDEITKLTNFARRINSSDDEIDLLNISKVREADKKLPIVSPSKLKGTYINCINGGVNTSVNVNVEVFREQSVNISASCIIPNKSHSHQRENRIFNRDNHIYSRSRSAGSRDNWARMHLLNNMETKLAASNDNNVMCNFKTVDIPLDDGQRSLKASDKSWNSWDQTALGNNLNANIKQDDVSRANEVDFEVLSLTLSLQEDENANKNKVAINLSNFGNANAFGFTITGAGAGMSRADRPTVSVESVGEASAAERAGLKVGDLLLEIDGTPTAGKYFYSVRRLLNESVTRAIVRDDSTEGNYGILRLVVRRSISPSVSRMNVSENKILPIDLITNEKNDLTQPFGNQYRVISAQSHSSFFNNSIASNNSSGLGSSISPSLSQKSDDQSASALAFSAHTRNNGCLRSLKASMNSDDENGDYRVISLDSRPTPGRLDDFVPEIERSFCSGTLKSTRTSQTKVPSITDDEISRRFHSLNVRRRVSNTETRSCDSTEPKLIRNYDLYLSDEDTHKIDSNSQAKDGKPRVETNENEWQQFAVNQRFPTSGIAANRNTMDADSKMQIVHPSGDKKKHKPVIQSLTRSDERQLENKKPIDERFPTGKHNGAPPIMTVSGCHICAHCDLPLGRGAAMIVEALNLFYHLSCFRCNICNIALGNGTRGADVRIRRNRLHCQKCFNINGHNNLGRVNNRV